MKGWDVKSENTRAGLNALQGTFKQLAALAAQVREGRGDLIEFERLLNSTLELPECVNEFAFAVCILAGLGPGRTGHEQLVNLAVATNHQSLLLLLVDGPTVEHVLGVVGILKIKLGGPTRSYGVERIKDVPVRTRAPSPSPADDPEYARPARAPAPGLTLTYASALSSSRVASAMDNLRQDNSKPIVGPANAAKAALQRRLSNGDIKTVDLGFQEARRPAAEPRADQRRSRRSGRERRDGGRANGTSGKTGSSDQAGSGKPSGGTNQRRGEANGARNSAQGKPNGGRARAESDNGGRARAEPDNGRRSQRGGASKPSSTPRGTSTGKPVMGAAECIKVATSIESGTRSAKPVDTPRTPAMKVSETPKPPTEKVSETPMPPATEPQKTPFPEAVPQKIPSPKANPPKVVDESKLSWAARCSEDGQE